MTPAERERLIRTVMKNRSLSMADLDALLHNDATFDRTAARLNARRGKALRVERPLAHPLPGPGLELSAWLQNTAGGTSQDVDIRYVREVAALPQLGRAEERLFAKRKEFFRLRFASAAKALKLSSDDTKALLDAAPQRRSAGRGPASFAWQGRRYPWSLIQDARDALAGCDECRRALVERSLHIVLRHVRPYWSYRIPLMDLVQEGNAALIRAVDLFDWRKGVRLETYAAYWIRQALERAIDANKGIIRIPHYMKQRIRRCKREGKLPAGDHAASAHEVSRTLGMTNQEAIRLVASSRTTLSLDELAGEVRGRRPDEPATSDWNHIVLERERAQTLVTRLDKALGGLSDHEQIVIRHRFGLGSLQQKTLEELGNMMKVSRERIRQIELRSLKRLREDARLAQVAELGV